MDTGQPSFPPLMRGAEVAPGVDPFAKAVAAAAMGTEPGVIFHRVADGTLEAALVLAPEAPLEDAMAMVFAAALGFADALGALAPPEVGVHMVWPGVFRVNGARCGALVADASTRDPKAEPDWLVVGLRMPLAHAPGTEPGRTPDETALAEEGCIEVPASRLLESWARHTLVWINTWLDQGMAKLHADWRARAFDMGKEVSFTLCGQRYEGTFMGLDERGGMLLRAGGETRLVPLSEMLDKG